MVHHRDQAKFDRAQWRLKVLVPAWMLQISLYLVLIAISTYLLVNTIDVTDQTGTTAIAWQSIVLGVASISTLCTAFEIIRTTVEALTPEEMVVSNLAKLAGIILSMIMGGMMSHTHLSAWSTGTQVIHGFLTIPTLALGSYAAWVWRCLAQYDEYYHPANIKPFGFKSDAKKEGLHSRNESDDWDVELRASWASRGIAMGNSVSITSPAPTASTADPASPETRGRGSSFVKVGGRLNFSMTSDVEATNARASRSRAASSSALMDANMASQPHPETHTTDPALSYISVTGTGLDRRASYNHIRDTAFDDYVRRQRASQGRAPPGPGDHHSVPLPRTRPRAGTDALVAAAREAPQLQQRHSLSQQEQQRLKNDVDDALSAEFGWGAASRSSSMDSVMAGGTPPAIAVGGGAVPNARSVRDSLGRAPSGGSERGALCSFPAYGDGYQDGDERRGSGDEDTRRRHVDEAGRALLGGGEEEEEEEDGVHPESLRPAGMAAGAGAGVRSRAVSETIEFIVTPPPRTPTGDGSGNSRRTWGAAYQV